MCGFWALFSPLEAIRRARSERDDQTQVLGLVRAWGDVAIHSREGFRAQHAAVACLFSERICCPHVVACPDDPIRSLISQLQQMFLPGPHPVPTDPETRGRLAAAAQKHGVPLVSMRDAVRHGVLRELGATSGMVSELQRRLPAAGSGR